MKRLLLTTTLLAAFALTAIAQRAERLPERAQEQIESFKIAFFTKNLQLTPEESQAFWPLFNQFEREREKLRDKYNLRGKKLDLMSDAEVEDFVMGQVQMAEDMAKLRRDYVERFKEILPIRKVAKLQQVDTEFKKELLKEIQRRRQNRQDGGGQRRRPGGGK